MAQPDTPHGAGQIIGCGPDGSQEVDLATASDDVVESWAAMGLPAAMQEYLKRQDKPDGTRVRSHRRA